jgi:hypothetical protein
MGGRFSQRRTVRAIRNWRLLAIVSASTKITRSRWPLRGSSRGTSPEGLLASKRSKGDGVGRREWEEGEREILTRLIDGEASGCLDATCRVRAHALEDARVDVQEAVYPEIVSVRERGGEGRWCRRGRWGRWEGGAIAARGGLSNASAGPFRPSRPLRR